MLQLVSFLLPSGTSSPENKTHPHKTKTKHRKHFIVEAIISMSQCVPRYISLSTHLHLQMFIAASQWSGLRSLSSVTPSIFDPHWISFWVLPCIMKILQLWLCRSGPFSDAISRRQGLLSCSHALRASSTVLSSQSMGPCFQSAAVCEERGQLLHFHTLKAGSPVPAFLCSLPAHSSAAAGERQLQPNIIKAFS